MGNTRRVTGDGESRWKAPKAPPLDMSKVDAARERLQALIDSGELQFTEQVVVSLQSFNFAGVKSLNFAAADAYGATGLPLTIGGNQQRTYVFELDRDPQQELREAGIKVEERFDAFKDTLSREERVVFSELDAEGAIPTHVDLTIEFGQIHGDPMVIREGANFNDDGFMAELNENKVSISAFRPEAKAQFERDVQKDQTSGISIRYSPFRIPF